MKRVAFAFRRRARARLPRARHGATPRAPPLVLLHGWMDVVASFQFLVDALARTLARDRARLAGLRPHGVAPRRLLVPRLRRRPRCAAARVVARRRRSHLVGHSLGANVAMIYAGVRPARVRSVVALDGFGIPAEDPERAPQKLREVARRARASAGLRALREPRRRRRPAAEEQSAAAARQGRVPRGALGRDVARRRRAAARRSAPQAAVSRPCTGWTRSYAMWRDDHRARAVGRGRGVAHSALARRRRRSRRAEIARRLRARAARRRSSPSPTPATCCITTSRDAVARARRSVPRRRDRRA